MEVLIGTSALNGPFSIAMLDYGNDKLSSGWEEAIKDADLGYSYSILNEEHFGATKSFPTTIQGLEGAICSHSELLR